MKKRILVAFDGSATAADALSKAAAIAEAENYALDILEVIDTRQYTAGFGQAGGVDGKLLYDAQTRAIAELEHTAAPLTERGLDVAVHVRFGSPRSVMAIDAPKDYHTSIIVIGRSNKRLVGRMFIGSVASFVVENAPCDVLVVSAADA